MKFKQVINPKMKFQHSKEKLDTYTNTHKQSHNKQFSTTSHIQIKPKNQPAQVTVIQFNYQLYHTIQLKKTKFN